LKIKYKYILYMCFISFLTLLPINLINSDGNRIETKPNRIIMKSNVREHVPYSKENTENGEIRVSPPVTNGKSVVQLLPIPDANSTIILIPLCHKE